MDPETLRIIVENAVKNATQFNWLYYIIVIVIAMISGFLGSYIRKKGENLATREDISEITRKVEEVRSQYAERMESISHQNKQIIEQGSRRHQLRMAALERRLETHQRAYTLWIKLIDSLNDEKQLKNIIKECQDFYVSNNLYLEANVRQAFINAYAVAGDRRTLLNCHAPVGLVEKNWEIIRLPGELLVKGVELPPIAEDKPEIKPPEDNQKA